MATEAPTLPTSMRGVQISQTGGVDVLELKDDLPMPNVGQGQVLVKIDYAGVNYIDTYFRTGLYPSPLPLLLGRECAGTVVSHSSPSSPNSPPIGSKVACLAGQTYAEYAATNISHTYVLPQNISTHIAAAALLQGLTALTLIREAHKVEKDQWVLLHAAAGGMGQWLAQLLRSVGAKTIGTASTPEKRENAKKNGCVEVLAYPEESEGGNDAFVAKINEITANQGVACVLDGVGKATFDLSLQCVARKGSLVSFGNASGAVPPVTISRLAGKNVKLTRPMLYGYVTTAEEFSGYARELFEIVGRGEVDVGIHKTYALSEVGEAHKDIEGRGTVGKLVLKMGE
ncbi:MAG: hypothetical protein Q9162_001096 [Coniocarpon cinnabarinum]